MMIVVVLIAVVDVGGTSVLVAGPAKVILTCLTTPFCVQGELSIRILGPNRR